MGYVVINDARRQESEELDLEAALRIARRQHGATAEPLRVVRAATGRTLLYYGHPGYRCVNRALADRPPLEVGSNQLDGGFSRPSERLEDAIARAASEYLRCLRHGMAAKIEVVDGAGRVYWQNGRPLSPS
jgi:hypothetical protein